MELIPAVLKDFTFPATVVRLILAMIVGGTIGLEREKKRRPAGFRTYMLVALGAALTMILSQYLNYLMDTDWAEVSKLVGIRTDVSRFGAQVINGVGFLGAGTIIVTGRQEVKGLTTAAGLWVAACMGLAAGAGFYEAVILCFLLVMLCMNVLPVIEDAFLAGSKNLNIYVELDDIAGLGAIAAKLKESEIKIYDTEFNKEQHDQLSQINAVISMRLPKKMLHVEVLAMISTVSGIISVEEI